jgi:environmental stress-induced protein Ves
VTLNPPHERIRFSGERPLAAELINGPTHDFNLIWHRDAVQVTVLHRPLVGAMVFFAEPGTTWLIHLIQGQAFFKDLARPLRLEQGDSALLLPDADGPSRRIIDGGGELLLAKISPL